MARKKLDCSITCPRCGANMAVFAIRNGSYLARCYFCGVAQFGPADLLDRLKYGMERVCAHKVEPKRCAKGDASTTFCRLCRVRSFLYDTTTARQT